MKVNSSAGTAAADTGDPDPGSDENPTEAENQTPPAGDEHRGGGQAGADQPGRPRRWWQRIRWNPGARSRSAARHRIAAVLLAVLCATAGYEGWVLYAQHQREVAAAEALDAAKGFTLALTSVDPDAIDKNFADVLDGATGEFKDMYSQSSEQLRALLIENKAAAHGTVIDAAVKSATNDTVEVMVFVDQSVSNSAAPGPQLDRSRVVITMQKVDGRWLAGKVDMK